MRAGGGGGVGFIFFSRGLGVGGGGGGGPVRRVVLDPERVSPELIGEGHTDAAGEFALTIDEPGAGFLMLDIELQTKRQDYTSVSERMQLPGSNERVIVTLTRGEDPKRLEAGNVLEETLRDAEPYLRD